VSSPDGIESSGGHPAERATAPILTHCGSSRRRCPSYGGARGAFQEINFREFETFAEAGRGRTTIRSGTMSQRHCEEQSDEAIQSHKEGWIASLRSQ
jgi:hypothetical protein